MKRCLVEKIPISDLCDQHGLQPSQIYYWQAQLFEHGASVFERKSGRPSSVETAKDRKIAQLEAIVERNSAAAANSSKPSPCPASDETGISWRGG